MWKQLIPGLRMTLLFTLLTGIVYPSLVTALCQALFPAQANGSLIVRNGKTIGSSLLGQSFTGAAYFHPRPSSAGANGYDAAASSGSNLGPTSRKLIDRVRDAKTAAQLNAGIPADMLTTSASGLDPHISPANAQIQTARVAQARGIAPSALAGLVARYTEPRDLGFLGEPRVNVLLLNLALDERWPAKPAAAPAQP